MTGRQDFDTALAELAPAPAPLDFASRALALATRRRRRRLAAAAVVLVAALAVPAAVVAHGRPARTPAADPAPPAPRYALLSYQRDTSDGHNGQWYAWDPATNRYVRTPYQLVPSPDGRYALLLDYLPNRWAIAPWSAAVRGTGLMWEPLEQSPGQDALASGHAGNVYAARTYVTFAWSRDSRTVFAVRVQRAENRILEITAVEAANKRQHDIPVPEGLRPRQQYLDLAAAPDGNLLIWNSGPYIRRTTFRWLNPTGTARTLEVFTGEDGVSGLLRRATSSAALSPDGRYALDVFTRTRVDLSNGGVTLVPPLPGALVGWLDDAHYLVLDGDRLVVTTLAGRVSRVRSLATLPGAPLPRIGSVYLAALGPRTAGAIPV